MPQYRNLYIAEKSSLAEAIALALADINGAKPSKSNGCWEVGEDVVAPLAGHMYETAEPEAYSDRYKSRNSVAALPIVIGHDDWKLVVADKKRKTDGATPAFQVDKKERIARIEGYMKQSRGLVNAGDAEREGQLLVDELILEAGRDPFGPDVKRLWVSSYVRSDMIAAIEGMRPNAERQRLYETALARQRADWLHGMNYSRLYSALAKQSGFDAYIRVGRVMSAVLRLVVDRDRERAKFKPTDYYIPRATFRHEQGSFVASWVVPAEYEGLDSEGRLVDKAVAARIGQKIDGKNGRISGFKAETKFTPPPLPFSLATLQAECSSKLDLTADETLEVAQSLYETHKATTYPRSSSRHLPLSMLDQVEGIMGALSQAPGLGAAARAADLSLRSAVWNDAESQEHHGIVPTTAFTAAMFEAMSPVEKKVFELIARPFIAAFHPPFKFRATVVDVLCEGERFKANGRVVVDQGWKNVYAKGEAEDEEKGDEDTSQALPQMAQGDTVVAKGGDVFSGRTSAPPAFNDGSLITAMVNAHRFETDPEIKKELREGDGIGTEATRAAILKKLLHKDVNMLARKGKTGLVSTSFGQSVIDLLPPDMTSLGVTAKMERQLGEIGKGALDMRVFLDRLAASIAERVEQSRDLKVSLRGVSVIKQLEGSGETCPKCKQGTLGTVEIHKGEHKGKSFLSCSRYPECDFRRWPRAKVDPLPGEGKPCDVCADGKMETIEFTSRKEGPTLGKKYRVLCCSNYPACQHREFPQRPPVAPIEGDGKLCATCKTGHMHTHEVQKEGPNKGKKFLGCDNRECRATEWPSTVPSLPGAGETCAVCGKGVMRMREYTDKKDNTVKGYLSCSAYPACRNSVFPGDGGAPRAPAPQVADLPGTGKKCPECGKGTLRTKGYADKKDGSPKSFLSCSAYPACKYREFPDDGRAKGGGDKAGSGRRQAGAGH